MFALSHKEYPGLERAKKDIKIASQLFDLYDDVIRTIYEWKMMPWGTMPNNIDILTCCKSVLDWDGDGRTFFDKITKDIELIHAALLRTGCVQGIKKDVAEYLQTFDSFTSILSDATPHWDHLILYLFITIGSGK